MNGIVTADGRPAAPKGADEVFEIPILVNSGGALSSRAHVRRVALVGGQEAKVADWLADLV